MRRAAFGPALAGAALVSSLMWGFKEEFNPDWWGYAAIYQDDGAWLADQGRDPLFLLLVGSLSGLLGPDGYDAFRVLIGLYFAAFTYVLLRGRVLPLGRLAPRWPMLLLGLLPVVALRFTVQIREGLALTLVLFGMAVLARQSRPVSSTPAQALPALLLFMAGAALHSGTGVLLLALLLGLLLGWVCAGSSRIELWSLLTLGLAAVALGAGVAVFGLTTRAGGELVDAVYDSLADDDAALSLLKWLYWAAYGVGVAAVAGRVHVLYGGGALPLRLRPVLGVIALVLLPAIYVAALLLLAAGMPAIVVAGAARIMNMLLSVTLLVLALRGVLSKRLGLFALLVLADQGRIMVDAVVGPAGAVP